MYFLQLSNLLYPHSNLTLAAYRCAVGELAAPPGRGRSAQSAKTARAVLATGGQSATWAKGT